ncbi:MAG: hypothetical protein AAGI23_14730 [Bacteroidota bacterium]
MKSITTAITMLCILTILLLPACSSNMVTYENEEVRYISVERTLPFPTDVIWDRVFMEYGDAHRFNPNVIHSAYIGNIDKAIVGAQRLLQQDDEGKKVLYERIEQINESDRLMRFKIYDAKGIPINTEVTYGESQLIEAGDDSTLFRVQFYYRTQPKFLATFANNTLLKDFEDMLIGIEYYLATGEAVTRENFGKIAEQYQ